MARFETERDAREYVEQNPDEVVHVDVAPIGELWFGIGSGGDFQILRSFPLGGRSEPHDFPPQGDGTPLPSERDQGPKATVLDREDTPFAG